MNLPTTKLISGENEKERKSISNYVVLYRKFAIFVSVKAHLQNASTGQFYIVPYDNKRAFVNCLISLSS
jgi:hypothetical protein